MPCLATVAHGPVSAEKSHRDDGRRGRRFWHHLLGNTSTYAGNDGQNTIFQLFDNLQFYTNPLNLFLFDQTYGLPLFKGYGVVVFCWIAVLNVRLAGRPSYMHQHLKLSAAINVPLFLLFCAEGEVRNLSMLYIAIVVLMAAALQRWLNSVSKRGDVG